MAKSKFENNNIIISAIILIAILLLLSLQFSSDYSFGDDPSGDAIVKEYIDTVNELKGELTGSTSSTSKYVISLESGVKNKKVAIVKIFPNGETKHMSPGEIALDFPGKSAKILNLNDKAKKLFGVMKKNKFFGVCIPLLGKVPSTPLGDFGDMAVTLNYMGAKSMLASNANSLLIKSQNEFKAADVVMRNIENAMNDLVKDLEEARADFESLNICEDIGPTSEEQVIIDKFHKAAIAAKTFVENNKKTYREKWELRESFRVIIEMQKAYIKYLNNL